MWSRVWGWLKRIGREVYEFFGPVASGIKGRVNPEESARVAVKALTTGGGTLGGLLATVKDPDFITTIVIPCTAAFIAGTLEYLSRKQQGRDPKDVPDAAQGTQ